MSNALYYMIATASSAAVGETPGMETQELVSIIVTAAVSASVFAAIITGLFNFFSTRNNSRIAERRNSTDADDQLVARYKDAAAEERVQKESAVQTVKSLLALAEEQIESLKRTVTSLTSTIEVMTQAAGAQQEIIDQITDERDRVQSALDTATLQLEAQREELMRSQQQIIELTTPASVIQEFTQDTGSHE